MKTNGYILQLIIVDKATVKEILGARWTRSAKLSHHCCGCLFIILTCGMLKTISISYTCLTAVTVVESKETLKGLCPPDQNYSVIKVPFWQL